MMSWLEVKLTPADDGTTLELIHEAHVDPDLWDQFGPGAVGVGWDLALLGLGLYVDSRGRSISARGGRLPHVARGRRVRPRGRDRLGRRRGRRRRRARSGARGGRAHRRLLHRGCREG